MSASDFGMGALIGAALPVLIAFIIQSAWPQQVKAIVSFVVCVIAAGATSFLTGAVRLDDPSFDWIAWLGTIYVAAQAAYAHFWKPTQVAPQVEKATNVTPTTTTRRRRKAA